MVHLPYDACLGALDDVTRAFKEGREGLKAPSRYEADLAAFKLMQQVWLHINSVSHLAAIPYTGSHLVSAYVLLRSAFETAVVASWLICEEDWKEREARWLGWVAGEEKHLENLAGEFKDINPEYASRLLDDARRLRERREAIAGLLPKDSRPSRPSVPQMMKDIGLARRYYVAYRIASHICHGGPGSWEHAVRQDAKWIVLEGVVKPAAWANAFRMAGWCVAQLGVLVLERAGAARPTCERLLTEHRRLLEATQGLEDSADL